jgi:hypothetical protein
VSVGHNFTLFQPQLPPKGAVALTLASLWHELQLRPKVPSTMADTRHTHCLVHGEDKFFKVTASLDNDIEDLKVLIYQCINVKKYAVVDTDLTLWEVSTL